MPDIRYCAVFVRKKVLYNNEVQYKLHVGMNCTFTCTYLPSLTLYLYQHAYVEVVCSVLEYRTTNAERRCLPCATVQIHDDHHLTTMMSKAAR